MQVVLAGVEFRKFGGTQLSLGKGRYNARIRVIL